MSMNYLSNFDSKIKFKKNTRVIQARPQHSSYAFQTLQKLKRRCSHCFCRCRGCIRHINIKLKHMKLPHLQVKQIQVILLQLHIISLLNPNNLQYCPFDEWKHSGRPNIILLILWFLQNNLKITPWIYWNGNSWN